MRVSIFILLYNIIPIKLTDVDPDTGCKEFEIEKGRFSFRLTAPHREERRRAASEAAKNE